MRKLNLKLLVLATIAVCFATFATKSFAVSNSDRFVNEPFTQFMHQNVTDQPIETEDGVLPSSEASIFLYKNLSQDFVNVSVIFYAFQDNPSYGATSFDTSIEGKSNGYASGPFVVNPPDAIKPLGANLKITEDYHSLPGRQIKDYQWPTEGKGIYPQAPRVNLVSICKEVVIGTEIRHVDYGHCTQSEAFFDTASSFGGNRLSINVPPLGEIWSNPIKDTFDGDYSNNNGVISFKIDTVEKVFN